MHLELIEDKMVFREVFGLGIVKVRLFCNVSESFRKGENIKGVSVDYFDFKAQGYITIFHNNMSEEDFDLCVNLSVPEILRQIKEDKTAIPIKDKAKED
jgi:hypothetical protein